MRVVVGIKALNEERHIEATVRSALAAVEPFNGTVVVADSGSRDDTVEIARRLGARVIQLADPSERSCGAGAQLAFQSADASDFFCLIDGDMTLVPGFLSAAINYLTENPQVAGVGGQITECNLETEEFQIRAAAMANEGHRRAGFVDRLDGGGLYRVSAIREVGYFSDRNLTSFEEFDLAARLASAGWKLTRIPVPAVEHHGHGGSGYRLLAWRLRSGQLSGAGQVLRGALGRQHFRFVVARLKHLRVAAAIYCWWALIFAAILLAPATTLLLVVLPIAFLSYRRRSVALGLFSFCLWNATALGILLGMLMRRVSPKRPLASRSLGGAAQVEAFAPVE